MPNSNPNGISVDLLLQFDETITAQTDFEKVTQFMEENPVSQAFLKREKGRLPYSVFKPTLE